MLLDRIAVFFTIVVTRSQSRATMATAPDPVREQLLQTLQDLLQTLSVPGTASTTPVSFATTPGQHKIDEVIDYGSKGGKQLYDSGCEALPIKFDMKAENTVVFVQQLKARAKVMGWSQGTHPLTEFNVTRGGSTTTYNLFEQYGQIPMDKSITKCKEFVGDGAHASTRSAQNNVMMHN